MTNVDAALKLKLNVLQCSVLYHKHFSRFDISQVLAGFGRHGKLTEVKAEDESVKLGTNGIEQLPFPCAICAKEVEDNKEGPTGEGLRCEGCWENFHNQCSDTPMDKPLYDQLMKSTPDFVKVYCPKCMVSVGNFKQKIEDIAEELSEVKAALKKIQEKEPANLDTATHEPYKAAAIKTLEKKVNETNKLVRNQIRKSDENKDEENQEVKENIRIVRKPKDVAIRNSKNLRKAFNQHYPNTLLKHARISAGGSYVLEFDKADDINEVEESWDNTYFGGNSGLVKINEKNCIGMVKYVYDDISEDEITRNINQNYPGTKHELFKKNDEFTGSIKVTFNNENDLKAAIANRFKIKSRYYMVESFKHKPRVIKCNTCQRFGHVSRLCRAKDNPICGKCTLNHETNECTTDETEYKCYHCHSSGHITGSFSCTKVQEKYQELLDRSNG